MPRVRTYFYGRLNASRTYESKQILLGGQSAGAKIQAKSARPNFDQSLAITLYITDRAEDETGAPHDGRSLGLARPLTLKHAKRLTKQHKGIRYVRG